MRVNMGKGHYVYKQLDGRGGHCFNMCRLCGRPSNTCKPTIQTCNHDRLAFQHWQITRHSHAKINMFTHFINIHTFIKLNISCILCCLMITFCLSFISSIHLYIFHLFNDSIFFYSFVAFFIFIINAHVTSQSLLTLSCPGTG